MIYHGNTFKANNLWTVDSSLSFRFIMTFLLVIVPKLKLRNKKTSNRYKLEKGSRLAVVTVAMGRNIGQYGGRTCAFRP